MSKTQLSVSRYHVPRRPANEWINVRWNQSGQSALLLRGGGVECQNGHGTVIVVANESYDCGDSEKFSPEASLPYKEARKHLGTTAP